jgi:hypothetical protein
MCRFVHLVQMALSVSVMSLPRLTKQPGPTGHQALVAEAWDLVLQTWTVGRPVLEHVCPEYVSATSGGQLQRPVWSQM